jgi:hypothetical protein
MADMYHYLTVTSCRQLTPQVFTARLAHRTTGEQDLTITLSNMVSISCTVLMSHYSTTVPADYLQPVLFVGVFYGFAPVEK